METTINTSVYGGITVLPCAASAAATLEVRGAAVREASVARAAIRTWDDATTGMKRAGFAPNHAQGSPAWSPPL